MKKGLNFLRIRNDSFAYLPHQTKVNLIEEDEKNRHCFQIVSKQNHKIHEVYNRLRFLSENNFQANANTTKLVVEQILESTNCCLFTLRGFMFYRHLNIMFRKFKLEIFYNSTNSEHTRTIIMNIK